MPDSKEFNCEFFCPHCNAILNGQEGFNPLLGEWICRNCGKQLMEEYVFYGERFEGIVWFCDQCGACLSTQFSSDGELFSDWESTWTCTECGYINQIDEDNIFEEAPTELGRFAWNDQLS